jgi:hypothetical protein
LLSKRLSQAAKELEVQPLLKAFRTGFKAGCDVAKLLPKAEDFLISLDIQQNLIGTVRLTAGLRGFETTASTTVQGLADLHTLTVEVPSPACSWAGFSEPTTYEVTPAGSAGTPVHIQLHRDGIVDQPLTVKVTAIGGTAAPGDFAISNPIATIAAGMPNGELILTAFPSAGGGDKTVFLGLGSAMIGTRPADIDTTHATVQVTIHPSPMYTLALAGGAGATPPFVNGTLISFDPPIAHVPATLSATWGSADVDLLTGQEAILPIKTAATGDYDVTLELKGVIDAAGVDHLATLMTDVAANEAANGLANLYVQINFELLVGDANGSGLFPPLPLGFVQMSTAELGGGYGGDFQFKSDNTNDPPWSNQTRRMFTLRIP